jgi:hypothetical protein
MCPHIMMVSRLDANGERHGIGVVAFDRKGNETGMNDEENSTRGVKHRRGRHRSKQITLGISEDVITKIPENDSSNSTATCIKIIQQKTSNSLPPLGRTLVRLTCNPGRLVHSVLPISPSQHPRINTTINADFLLFISNIAPWPLRTDRFFILTDKNVVIFTEQTINVLKCTTRGLWVEKVK